MYVCSSGKPPSDAVYVRDRNVGTKILVRHPPKKVEGLLDVIQRAVNVVSTQSGDPSISRQQLHRGCEGSTVCHGMASLLTPYASLNFTVRGMGKTVATLRNIASHAIAQPAHLRMQGVYPYGSKVS